MQGLNMTSPFIAYRGEHSIFHEIPPPHLNLIGWILNFKSKLNMEMLSIAFVSSGGGMVFLNMNCQPIKNMTQS